MLSNNTTDSPGKKFDFLIFVVFLSASIAAFLLQPTNRLDLVGSEMSLEDVPQKFSNWQIDNTIVPVAVSPDVQATLDKVYEKILSRTYVNDIGQRVMLSIAYGGDQSRALQAHKPETCYTAQGFIVRSMGNAEIDYNNHTIFTRRLIAKHGNRVEPITYWIRVGESTVYGGLGQALARIKYGLQGSIPDGLLFRVSTVGIEDVDSYQVQEQFIVDLLNHLDPTLRTQLIGTAK